MAVAFKKNREGVTYEVRTAGKTVRLYTNGAFHSQYNPRHLFTGAVWDLLSLPSLSTDHAVRDALVLGVGGGTVIHQLDALQDIRRVIGIELDPVHLHIAKHHFALSYRHTELIIADARNWLNRQTGQFDYIVDDVYLHGDTDPERPFFPDRQWCDLLCRHLKPGGAVVQNHIDSAHARDVKQRFDHFFDQVLIYSNNLYSNTVLAGYFTSASKSELKRRCEQKLNRLPRGVTSRLRHCIG